MGMDHTPVGQKDAQREGAEHEQVLATPHPRADAAAPGEGAEELARERDAHALGRHAESPSEIPWRGWKAVLRRTAIEMISDRAGLVAAGCAFYATLALFPAISMLVSIYGMAFNVVTVEPQLEVLRGLLPPSAYGLIADRVHALVTAPQATLGLSLLVSLGLALWSASAAIKSLIAALNLAYEETERRGFLHYQVSALAMTLCAIVGAAIGLALLVGLPAILAFMELPSGQQGLIRGASLVLLLLFVLVGLSLLYRYGPCRTVPRWHWVTPGSLVATFLWAVVSYGFSWYVANVATYDAMYGPLGAVVGTMMWFWVTIYAVLLGAELNGELELQTARDSTDGPPRPMGARGAYVADHVAAD